MVNGIGQAGSASAFSLENDCPPLRVPFLDLHAQIAALGEGVRQAIDEVLHDGDFIGGAHLARFEDQFAQYCGAAYCVGVANGTDALTLALHALGIGPGDEVITAANTFIATAESIAQSGATPVLVDVDPETCLMDLTAVESAITPRTRAIVPVHLYGQMVDMPAVLSLAEGEGCVVIEDACQAHGSKRGERMAGSFGHAAAFSFYPGKNLGAYGNGGALVTNDEKIAQRVRMLANHGRSEDGSHDLLGGNSRLDGFQAAVLSVKLPFLDRWNAERRRLAGLYAQGLSGIPGITLLPEEMEREDNFHLYVIRAQFRDSLQEHLRRNSIETRIHYAVPVHMQPAFAYLGYREGDFPAAERAAAEILSLPMFPEMPASNVSLVTETIRRFTTSDGG